MIESTTNALLSILGVPWLTCLLWIAYGRLRARQIRQRRQDGRIWAFYHPYCAGGGGGERVLWKALEVLGAMAESDYSISKVIIYTIDAPSPTYQRDLLRHVQERFSITLSDNLPIEFVHLSEHKHLLNPSPRLSLVMESLGTLRLAWHGLQQSQQAGILPDIFCDTTGAAFTFLPARWYFGCQIVAYVHYPTISTDMLGMVWQRRRAAYNHSSEISGSRIKTAVKLVYYTVFAVLYGLVGSIATLVLVNSTWTYNHIRFLWKGPAWFSKIHICYPPCAVQDLVQSTSITAARQSCIVSIGQFRPEKDHVLQIEALGQLLKDHGKELASTKLILIGGCRNADDEARLDYLRKLVTTLKLQANVEFCVNQPYSTIKHWLAKASVGIHTMWNEHFGIGIVEMMAAGLLVVAHNSGGPQSDIIEPSQTGFLATTVEEYAEALFQALTTPQAAAMRKAARQSAQRFSDEVFAESFRENIVRAKLV